MYPASTPLVPDDRYHERDFTPRDLDAERDLQRMRRPVRQNAIKKSSVASRTVRSLSRFFAAVLIGVALTLAGQAYSGQLNEMITVWVPSAAWLLPVQNTNKTADGAVSSDVAQQIQQIAADLAIVRRNMGQLAANQDQFAAKQEQMNQNIATLQQVEQGVRQQVLAPPAPKPQHPPAHNPPQSPAR
jgi:hypothetical protein